MSTTHTHIFMQTKNIVVICMEVGSVIYVINMKLGYQFEAEVRSPEDSSLYILLRGLVENLKTLLT